ncbi:MAG: hypothetical protein E5W81_06930 [Mesorhizobium sp.]|nr:MAG: hypothetical protein E5W81_06930 [Mesorhizobium sp.]
MVNDAELAAIWTGCEPEPGDSGYSFGSIVKLLMLTGQRRTEVAAMRWSELNLEAGTWELSGDRTKNEEPTLIPQSTLAVSVLQSVPKTNDTFVFPGRDNEKSHFSGYAKGKKALDGKVNIDGVALENWTLHDLRRTLATNLGRRQVLPHVIEHILNHKAGVPDRHGRNLQSLYLRQGKARGVADVVKSHRMADQAGGGNGRSGGVAAGMGGRCGATIVSASSNWRSCLTSKCAANASMADQ